MKFGGVPASTRGRLLVEAYPVAVRMDGFTYMYARQNAATGSVRTGRLPLHLALRGTAAAAERRYNERCDAVIQYIDSYLLEVGPAAASAQDPAKNMVRDYLASSGADRQRWTDIY